MASTITQISSLIDTTFPVPGQDNDTQGFRNNFANIKIGLERAAEEISDLDIIQIGIANQLSNFTNPTRFDGTQVTSTNITSVTISNSGTITTNSLLSQGNITTNGKFVGDGSLLTNIPRTDITSLGTLTSLTIEGGDTDANITVNNGTMVITGINNLVFSSTATTSTTLVGSLGPGLSVSTLTVASVVGINIGDTFKLYSTDTVRSIFNVNTATNQITTTVFNPTLAIGAGVTSGSIITFNKGVLSGSSTYTSSAPTTSKGARGDKKGMVFATSAFIYVCYADFTTGIPDIWARSATSAASW
jgi:hypothetical protein